MNQNGRPKTMCWTPRGMSYLNPRVVYCVYMQKQRKLLRVLKKIMLEQKIDILGCL